MNHTILVYTNKLKMQHFKCLTVSYSEPHIVSLYNRGHFCGGALITKDWVLLSASCLVSFGSVRTSVTARLGEHNIGETEGTEQW